MVILKGVQMNIFNFCESLREIRGIIKAMVVVNRLTRGSRWTEWQAARKGQFLCMGAQSSTNAPTPAPTPTSWLDGQSTASWCTTAGTSTATLLQLDDGVTLLESLGTSLFTTTHQAWAGAKSGLTMVGHCFYTYLLSQDFWIRSSKTQSRKN